MVDIPGPGLRQAASATHRSTSSSVRQFAAKFDTVAQWVEFAQVTSDGLKSTLETFGVTENAQAGLESISKPLSDSIKIGATVFSCAKAVRSLPGDLRKVHGAITDAESGKRFASGAAASSSMLKNVGILSTNAAGIIGVLGLAVNPVPFAVGGVVLGVLSAAAVLADKRSAYVAQREEARTDRSAARVVVSAAIESQFPRTASLIRGGRSQVEILTENVEALIRAFEYTKRSLDSMEREQIRPKGIVVRSLVGGSSNPKHEETLAAIVRAVSSMRTTQEELEAAQRALRQVISNI